MERKSDVNFRHMNLVNYFLLFLAKTGVAFNLHYVSLDPMPKPPFLINATYEVIEQFMGLLRVPFIDAKRKVILSVKLNKAVSLLQF